ncbi:MAG: DUF3794 and LysM peptidoglycan-binding domain-containing protein [Christensenellales bacterium]
MELIKETVNIEQLVGNVDAQAVVDGELTLPAMKPDIVNLLMVQGKVTMGNVECVAGKLLMDGTVSFCVVYDGEEGITGFEATAGFNNTVDMEEAAPGMKGNVTAFIQQIDSYLMNERKLHVTAIVEMECSVRSAGEEVVVTDIQNGIDYEMLRSNNLIPDIERCQDHYTVREDAVLPPGARPVKEVLFADGYARMKNVMEQSGEMFVSGEVKILLSYCSEEGTLEQAQLVLPVECALKCDKISGDTRNYAQLKIQEIYVKKADEEGRVLNMEVQLHADGCCLKQNEMDLVSDCYSTIRQVDIDYKTLQTMVLSVVENTRAVIKTKLEIPEGIPACARPLVCYASPMITQKTILENSLELQGILTIHLVYEQHGGQRYVFKTQAPFACDLEAKGLNNAMRCDVDVVTEGCYTSGSGNEIEVKTVLDIDMRCYQNWTVPIVSGITENEMKPEPPQGIKIYFTGEGETLWSVAKQFNMTSDMILRHNPAVDTKGTLPAGQKILLFRRYAS